MKKWRPLKLPLVLLTAAVIGAVAVVLWKNAGDSPLSAGPPGGTSAPAKASDLQASLDAAWTARLAELGAAPAAETVEAAASEFARLHAADLAEIERLSGAESSAPYAKQVAALSRRAAARVAEYDAVRAKLRSGELSVLPSDLAPPPLPTPAAETPVP